MKEKLCYTAYNIDQEQQLATETTYLTESYTVGVLLLLLFFNQQVFNLLIKLLIAINSYLMAE